MTKLKNLNDFECASCDSFCDNPLKSVRVSDLKKEAIQRRKEKMKTNNGMDTEDWDDFFNITLKDLK